MNKKKKLIIIGIILFILYSIGLYKLASNPTGIISTKTNDPYLARFIENYNTLKNDWYYFQGDEKVIEAATEAMTLSNEKNDVYTEYIPASETKEYFDALESEYVGVGVQFAIINNKPMITHVYEGSPGAKAGLQTGDYLLKCDGKSLEGLTTTEVQNKIVGKAGITRKIEYQRNNQTKTVSIVLKKMDASVQYHISDGIGYIKINDFTATMPDNVKKALQYMEDKKVKKVILDLRDNAGGYLDSLQELADLFLPPNKIVLQTKDKSGKVVSYKTTDNVEYKFDYTILTNGNTASAAEAFVACLHENLNIPIYGQKTFGKGIMQSFFEYKDGSYLKYTSAEWLTPKGNAINKKGIEPTHKIDANAINKVANMSYQIDKDIKYDSVDMNLKFYQNALNALGYKVDRTDGYYSKATATAVNEFKEKYNLTSEADLSKKVQSEIVRQIYLAKDKASNDNVLKEVMSILK
ncbi:MAG: PDZ domain-containing protein [Bacilli bacterium]|jgi:carboxyl-terminal processing protease|nr:PDZ domain-containing protein [Bacilli bacterium]